MSGTTAVSKIALVAFAARPGYGSEGGVGWAFIRSAIEVSRSNPDVQITCILDSRDKAEIERALADIAIEANTRFVFIGVPAIVGHHNATKKTRIGYLAWRARVETRFRRDPYLRGMDVVHHATFATGSLPPVMGGRGNLKRIWGPIAIQPSTDLRGMMSRAVARYYSSRVESVIFTNERSMRLVPQSARTKQYLEPNVVAHAPSEMPKKSNDLIALVGHLIDGKRPEIAVASLADPALRHARLIVVGDGALKKELEILADRLGVADRVEFAGRLSRESTLQVLAKARVLLHPSASEGASWVVGEAAAVGTAAVVCLDSGADTTAAMGGGAFRIVKKQAQPEDFARAAADLLLQDDLKPSHRWDWDRIPRLLEDWWGVR